MKTPAHSVHSPKATPHSAAPSFDGISRRQFLHGTAAIAASAGLGALPACAQERGQRPEPSPGVTVLNPRNRVPVGLIIDDSTCLVNLNRFAMPQFDEAWNGREPVYHRNWRDWPAEIPDTFVRRFGEWALDRGVKGKYSIVPFPACVGRMDRFLPGWTRRELQDSLRLVRETLAPHWDIHPEMITHTRVLDLKTGQPYAESSPAFMENWDWSANRSADELGAYLAYALRILKEAGLACEGITTPGGFGSRARPQLAQATLESVRDVFGAEIPHYFRDLHDSGTASVAPRVELASDLNSTAPRCVVSIVGCTGDWTGGWDCVEPEGPDRFISADLERGRMVEVIDRGEPAFMVCHWTGIYWNGEEHGFKVLQEVERRLRNRFGNRILWMKTSELARYWAARELTSITPGKNGITFRAPFACPDFTFRWMTAAVGKMVFDTGQERRELRQVQSARNLEPGTWCQDGDHRLVCINLAKGSSALTA